MSPGPCVALGDSVVVTGHGSGPVADVSPGSCSHGDAWDCDGHNPLMASRWPVARNPAPGRCPGAIVTPQRQPELPVTHRDSGHGHREATPGHPHSPAVPAATCPVPPQDTWGSLKPSDTCGAAWGWESNILGTNLALVPVGAPWAAVEPWRCRGAGLWAGGIWGWGPTIPQRHTVQAAHPCPVHPQQTPPSFSAPPTTVQTHTATAGPTTAGPAGGSL